MAGGPGTGRETRVVGETVWVSERPGEWQGSRVGLVVGLAGQGPRIVPGKDGWVCLAGGHAERGTLEHLMEKYS
jgi:hypothetical protein